MLLAKLVITATAAALALPISTHAAPVVTTIAGTGTAGFSGDLGPAVSAQLNSPNGLAVSADGSLLVADFGNRRIRRITGDGTITTVAGQLAVFNLNDGGPATLASFAATRVSALPDGGYLIPDVHRLRRVLPDGRITTIAGGINLGFSGEGTSATSALFNSVADGAAEPTGSVVVVDQGNHRIRRVTGNIVTTVAGNGTNGVSGDGGPAIDATLANPRSIAVGSDGTIYVGGSAQVRAIGPDGVIRAFAGTGVGGFSGDGGPATSAQIRNVDGLSVAPDGSLLIADTDNDRIRRVDPTGTISTIAGNGARGSAVDGTSALDAPLNLPAAVVGLRDGSIVIVNRGNHSVLRLGELPTPTPSPSPSPGPAPTPGPAAGAVVPSTRGQCLHRVAEATADRGQGGPHGSSQRQRERGSQGADRRPPAGPCRRHPGQVAPERWRHDHLAHAEEWRAAARGPVQPHRDGHRHRRPDRDRDRARHAHTPLDARATQAPFRNG